MKPARDNRRISKNQRNARRRSFWKDRTHRFERRTWLNRKEDKKGFIMGPGDRSNETVHDG